MLLLASKGDNYTIQMQKVVDELKTISVALHKIAGIDDPAQKRKNSFAGDDELL